MKNYVYQNNLISKKQLRHLLGWSFTNYDSMQACSLADELKYLGFKYASQAGISISIEDLKIPFVKNSMLDKANQEILNAEKIYLKGKITEVERLQKIIDTWSLTSESLKDQIVYFFKNYDPLNSVYIMAFSGARGNLSQVRQLVGMRGLMSDPSGEIMNLPIKKNFREGLTITDYLMSGYGARKGIVDTALKTANSGYLTRRLIDVGHDILIREKDCLTTHSILFLIPLNEINEDCSIYTKLLGRILNKPIIDCKTNDLIAKINTQITPKLIKNFKERKVTKFYVRSPLTCSLYRAICQKCYGWDLANENLVDIGEAVGILAGQSIGEPGTQLTMRTFHTGGIFTSEARQQIISPSNGIIQFYKNLKTFSLRTNRGEEVLVTKNSGALTLIPENKDKELIKIEVLRNTILFPKNNQYLLKDTVIGELINTNKQIKTEIKPIVTYNCGEVFIPKLKQKINLLNNNRLIWILSGQLYNSPVSSFINFHPDYKVNRHSYIFRTKLINHYNGLVNFMNKKNSLYQRIVKINTNRYSFNNSKLEKLESVIEFKNYLLNLNNFKYLIKIQKKNYKNYLQMTGDNKAAILLTNTFRTLTGGTLFYNHKTLYKTIKKNLNISYYSIYGLNKKSKSFVFHKTITWLGEEIHNVNCEQNILLVEHNDFISKGFEIIPNLFSKTSGLILMDQKNNIVKRISIKSGVVYEGRKFKDVSKKFYYPGEILFSNIIITNPSFCEHIIGKKVDQLLVRPIEIYEFPHSMDSICNSDLNYNYKSNFNFESTTRYVYKSNQNIKSKRSLNLILNVLGFKTNKPLDNNIKIELLNNRKHNLVNLKIIEKLSLNNYIPPHLKYKNIKSCFIVQENQFVSGYMNLGYLEAVVSDSLEIVKFKVKKSQSKQILLISNNDCLLVEKDKIVNKKLNDFVTNILDVNQTGKIIIENNKFFTIQKGKPYFFPNCNNENLVSKTNLEYKLLSPNRIKFDFNTQRNIYLNYYNLVKLSVRKKYRTHEFLNPTSKIKSEFSKLFLKNNGKFYSCLIPQFLKKFVINKKKSKVSFNHLLQSNKHRKLFLRQMDRSILLHNSKMCKNKFKDLRKLDCQLLLLKFIEQPFIKATKSIGLYSITEDYFELEANSVFCKNREFIEVGKTIGLLSLEKEITGDIVQGLPRIEEILEGRKKNLAIKRIPTSQKKGLLVQKTSLDINFEFRKLGTTIKENDKINPHKLLKVYFNYYGLIKLFLCDKSKLLKYNRIINNYEGSYKSFKKVQSFILNSVQSVYQSQGVTINDKHLEIVIKQMTTKVLITYEGNTPLLRREVIDLYHIHYINKIINIQMKQMACYVPLLLGITKAALNNPSFISAASFQETTRVLTKAAIEGRIDWLRGLKENIIIGHLIPAGTGSQNYRNCFKQHLTKYKITEKIIKNEPEINIIKTSRQVF